MKTQLKSTLILSALCGAMVLTGCNGINNDDPSTDDSSQSQQNAGNNQTPQVQKDTLTGVAAQGKPLAGSQITVQNKNGVMTSSTVSTDGTFTVSIDAGAPYTLKITKDGQDYYSYSAKAGYVNINQLTTQAVIDAYGANVNNLWTDWKTQSAMLTQDKIDASAKKVAANLKQALGSQLTAQSIDATKLNIFNNQFSANNTGFDSILDDIHITYNCSANSCNAQYNIGSNQSYTWNWSVNTNGYTVTLDSQNNPSIPQGNYNLTVAVTGTAMGVSIPPTTSVIKNIPKPDNQSQFCASDLVNQQWANAGVNMKVDGCSFDGTTGKMNISGTVQGVAFNYIYAYTYTAA